MADTYTTALQLLKQETGNNNNNWGNLLNTQVIDRTEQAIAGSSYIAVTGGTTVLTDDQARAAVLVIQGALTSNAIVEVPSRYKSWKVYNGTTGNFHVAIKTSAGASFVLARNALQDLWCDTATIYETGPGQVPLGGSVHFFGFTIPANFAEMNGQALSRDLYKRLFDVIGTTWGTGDGSTTFNLPNAQDRYMRARSSTYSLGYLSQDVQAHTHTAVTDTQGYHGHSVSASTTSNHNHSYTTIQGTTAGSLNFGGLAVAYGSVVTNTGGDGSHTHTVWIVGEGSHAHNVTVTATGGAETRPNTIIGIALMRVQ